MSEVRVDDSSDVPDFGFDVLVPDIRESDGMLLDRMANHLLAEREFQRPSVLLSAYDAAATHPARIVAMRQRPVPEVAAAGGPIIPILSRRMSSQDREKAIETALAEARTEKLRSVTAYHRLIRSVCDIVTDAEKEHVTSRFTHNPRIVRPGIVCPNDDVLTYLRNPANGPISKIFSERRTAQQVNSADRLTTAAANRALIVGIAHYAVRTAVH